MGQGKVALAARLVRRALQEINPRKVKGSRGGMLGVGLEEFAQEGGGVLAELPVVGTEGG